MKTEIRYKGHDDLRDVHTFLNETALERFGVNTPVLLDRFCIAYEHEQVVACCGGSLARDGEMHIEKIYDFGKGFAEELARNRDRYSQIGRWMSHDPVFTPAVLRGLIESLQADGAEYAICEIVPASMRRARMLGLSFTPVEAVLQPMVVDPIERDYYLRALPRVYRVDFSSIAWS